MHQSTRLVRRFSCFYLLAGFIAFSLFATADDVETLLVKKQRFTTTEFKTTSGEIISIVNVGWESYGTLNTNKDNVILISHYFTGTSHAAGKYSLGDKRAGYWDAIIGPGKAIDTNLYYVISMDSLVNINVKDPNVITTGPATINPKTNAPYGLDFPVVTIRDFVNVQYALLQSLGITELHAAVGASMGSHQALEWASAYPDMVKRVISVIGIGETDSWGKADLERWARPIRNDANWNHGDYYGKNEPIDGLTTSLASIILSANNGYIFDRRYKEKMNADSAPGESILNDFAVNKWIMGVAHHKAITKVDANHVLYLTRACQLFRIGHKDTLAEGVAPIKAKILLLPSKNDVLLPARHARKLQLELQIQNKRVEYEEIEGPWGHLDGLYSIGVKNKIIRDFLSSP